MLERMIAIDTEYHTNALGMIDKVYCLCAQNASGKTFKRWTSNLSPDETKHILDELSAFFGIENPIFVCHAFDKAERRALKFLGVDNSKYDFICTYYLAKMLQNSFTKSSANRLLSNQSLTTEEHIAVHRIMKSVQNVSLSYAGLCHRYKLALIDTEHKEAMRKLCITDNTDGHEQEIMDYCASDTQFLIPLLQNLFKEYALLLKNSFCPLSPNTFNQLDAEKVVKLLVLQMKYVNDFGDIADEGIPLNLDRVAKTKTNAPVWREQLKSQFNEQYPGCYNLNPKTGFFVRSDNGVQKYLSECISKFKIKNYPTTNGGKLNTDDDTLKAYFKGTDCFGEQYRQHKKFITILNKVAGTTDNPLDSIVDGKLWYESLEPCGTITGRCTPKRKFIFGWHKSFYGLMDPPKGKWLVELDYSSEETFIQACICRDNAYYDIYRSKDIYLAFAHHMGYIPTSDWEALSKDELKAKYKSVRAMIKPMILGMSYGMGPNKLAATVGIPLEKAKAIVSKINKTILRSTTYKQCLMDYAAVHNSKAFSLPDGFICKYDPNTANHTTVTNWSFQSGGSMILKYLVHSLMENIRNGSLNCKILATIHDAIFFEVNEGDCETINRVANLMKDVANQVLAAPTDWTIKVGSPEIVKHGEIWTPDNAWNKQFADLLNYTA